MSDEIYRKISSRLREHVGSSNYDDLGLLISEDSLASIDSFVLSQGADPDTCLDLAVKALRSEFELDYDDLLFHGNYVDSIPSAIVRNSLLAHFISMSQSPQDGYEPKYDATLNSVAGDYVTLAELILIKIETLAEKNGYVLDPENVPLTVKYLTSIRYLISQSWHMLDMSSVMKPATFKRKCFRLRSRLNSVIEMATFKRPYPEIDSLKNEISDLVEEILKDEKLDDLQAARNERYKQSKIRLYNYTIRMTEQLNIQLEACNPLDITHREDLKKQLEAVQRFMRSFDKDR